jgi:hypothetical protein
VILGERALESSLLPFSQGAVSVPGFGKRGIEIVVAPVIGQLRNDPG